MEVEVNYEMNNEYNQVFDNRPMPSVFLTSSINNKIIAGASILDSNLSKFAFMNSIKNLEFYSSIPGSIGGAVKMKTPSSKLSSCRFIVFNSSTDTKPAGKLCCKNLIACFSLTPIEL